MDRAGDPASREPRVEVAVVGTVNLDETARVARLPAVGETVVVDGLRRAPGGKGANQAVAAARQGARTAIVGCLGDDAAGDEVERFLAAQPGLDRRGLARVAGETGRAFVTVDEAGASTIVSSRGANRALDEARVHRAGGLIGQASVLLVQLGVDPDAVRAALEIARSVGTTTVLDPSPAGEVTDELLWLADLCTPNAVEAAQLTGCPVDDVAGARRAAATLVARGCPAVVVTLAEQGAVVAGDAWPSGGRWVEPFPVSVVDPTAAGDAFCGALAAALARGVPLDDALVDACAAGALAVTQAGAGPSLPTAAEVAALRGRH